jgi:hypothetical protein
VVVPSPQPRVRMILTSRLLAGAAVVILTIPAGAASGGVASADATAPGGAETALPRQVAAPIQGPVLPEKPVAGKGRLRIAFSGNLRWCTFQDDRLLKPPPRMPHGQPMQRQDEVHTFGYQFTIAGVERSAPTVPVILYESPIFRTASLLPAFKVGRSATKREPTRVGPSVGAGPQASGTPTGEGPASLVPVWHEEYRCATLPDHFDFDLDPGTYDIYLAFDILNRQGGWYHRTTDFLTDVAVEEGRGTLLEARPVFRGEDRSFNLQSPRLLPEGGASGTEGVARRPGP